MDIRNIINDLQTKAEQAITLNDGDYEKEGLLYCGKCNTPKQTRVTILGETVKPFCLCKCMIEQREREQAEIKKAEHLQKVKVLRDAMGFPADDTDGMTFDRDDGSNAKITTIAKRYVDNFPEMRRRGKGILFFGTVGTGKTFAAACIANELTERGCACLVTNFARLTNTITGMMQGKQDYIDGLNKFDLVVIDDLAAERDTEYMSEVIYTIIDSRYRSGKPLIITTNLTAVELKHPADVRKQRIYSRLLEMCIPVEVTGKDRRKETLKDDYNDLKGLLGL